MEAHHYTKLDAQEVQCRLCPHRCRIGPGKKGRCRVRANVNGRLEAAGYGQAVSVAVDPIEKKPLFHFYPGTNILSTGPNGCNLSCRFCQNWEISQTEQPTTAVPPSGLADLAVANGTIGVAYTYTEPLVWFEYLLDACAAVRDRGLVNVLVTNGTIEPGPLRELLPLVDAMNIDLKSMDRAFYREVCGGDRDAVLRTIELAQAACRVELTNLVIPGLNDSGRDMDDLIGWVAGLDELLPLHFSRYFPRYELGVPSTPESTLRLYRDKAREKLKYVYLGNITLAGAEDTCCPQCDNTLIVRQGYHARIIGVNGTNCGRCGRAADITGL